MGIILFSPIFINLTSFSLEKCLENQVSLPSNSKENTIPSPSTPIQTTADMDWEVFMEMYGGQDFDELFAWHGENYQYLSPCSSFSSSPSSS